jgi:hypothetical protein
MAKRKQSRCQDRARKSTLGDLERVVANNWPWIAALSATIVGYFLLKKKKEGQFVLVAKTTPATAATATSTPTPLLQPVSMQTASATVNVVELQAAAEAACQAEAARHGSSDPGAMQACIEMMKAQLLAEHARNIDALKGTVYANVAAKEPIVLSPPQSIGPVVTPTFYAGGILDPNKFV